MPQPLSYVIRILIRYSSREFGKCLYILFYSKYVHYDNPSKFVGFQVSSLLFVYIHIFLSIVLFIFYFMTWPTENIQKNKNRTLLLINYSECGFMVFMDQFSLVYKTIYTGIRWFYMCLIFSALSSVAFIFIIISVDCIIYNDSMKSILYSFRLFKIQQCVRWSIEKYKL